MQIEQLQANLRTYCSDREKLKRDGLDTTELDRIIQKLEVVLDLSNTVWPLSFIFEWMSTPNAAFNNRTPNQVIAEGDGHLLTQMLVTLNIGMPL
jgi:hypothetical protein